MSASPLLALRAALLARFADDAALKALMGGTVRLHDEPPRGAVPVYALFGEAGSRDDSVDGARRHVLSHALIVIAKPGSARTALDAAARMATLAEDGLALTGHSLVTLVAESLSASRDARSGETRAVLTLRAVTETP